MTRKNILLFVLLPGLMLLLNSCAYYNTFYNAKKLFDTAQKMEVRENGRPVPIAIQNYNKVIEKCAYILREYPNSKWADDALFLMARSNYYKKQNILQAKEQFRNLIRIFPKSDYVPESYIYIAEIDFEMNSFAEGHQIYNELLMNQAYSDYHAKVLLAQSRVYIEQSDYEKARINLRRIINDYSSKKEYETAYIALGNSYLETEDYTKAKEIFETILNLRLPRRTRMNAQYYLALCEFYLQNYTESLNTVRELIRLEYQADLLPRLQLLQARIFAGIKQYQQAETLFQSVIENNKRTSYSAEASYHLAQMYFLDLLEYEKAISAYNQVRSEFVNSPFTEKAIERSSVVSQIVQFSDTKRNITTRELIDEQLKLAEYYLYVLNLPDSSFAVYDNIRKQSGRLQTKRDSLFLELENMTAEDDTLLYAEAKTDLERVDADAKLFTERFVPYSLFSSAWVWFSIKNNAEKANEYYLVMKDEYPENPYTYAIQKMLDGKEIIVATDFELAIRDEYEEYIAIMDNEPEKSIEGLQTIAEEIKDKLQKNQQTPYQILPSLYHKTIFSLGYINYFVLEDSTSSKVYFDEILESKEQVLYKQFISRFYGENGFIVTEILPSLIPKEEEETELQEEVILEKEETKPELKKELIFDEEKAKLEIKDEKDFKQDEPEKPKE